MIKTQAARFGKKILCITTDKILLVTERTFSMACSLNNLAFRKYHLTSKMFNKRMHFNSFKKSAQIMHALGILISTITLLVITQRLLVHYAKYHLKPFLIVKVILLKKGSISIYLDTIFPRSIIAVRRQSKHPYCKFTILWQLSLKHEHHSVDKPPLLNCRYNSMSLMLIAKRVYFRQMELMPNVIY